MLDQTSIFKDLKIVELASVLAGPMVGTFFSELGASVLKIENEITGGDVTRKWKLPNEKNEELSSYFVSANYGKESIFIDLKSEEGRKKAETYIKDADIVISNFKKPSAARLKMDYESLAPLNPRMIYGQISGYHADPHRSAYDAVLQAEMGFISMCGSPGFPAKVPVAIIDLLCAHQLKEGILTALLIREKTGKGAFVYAALDDSAIASLANQASNYLMYGSIPQRMGTLHPNISPYGEIFLTKDGQEIILAIGSNKQFTSCLEILGLSTLKADERFTANTDRITNRTEIRQLFADQIQEKTFVELSQQFKSAGIPSGIVQDLGKILDDPTYSHMVLKHNKSGSRKSVRSVTFQITGYDN